MAVIFSSAKKEKSGFYKIATFYSGNEIIGMFDKVGIRYLESYQTLMQLLAFPEMQEEPVLGLTSCVLLLFFLARDVWIIGSLALLAGIVYNFSNSGSYWSNFLCRPVWLL